MRQLTCTVYLFLLEISIVEAWFHIVSGEPGLLFLCHRLRLAVDLMVAVVDISGGNWCVISGCSGLVLVVSRGAIVLEL